MKQLPSYLWTIDSTWTQGDHLFIVSHTVVSEQLWSHVLLGPSLSVEASGSVELRHTIVRQLHIYPVLWVERPDENVARFNVTVDDVERVKVADSIGHLREGEKREKDEKERERGVNKMKLQNFLQHT